jgi:uncharacterized membrane protein YedE/YeeE
MMKVMSAYAIGLVFGIGIMISGMANPAKVLNFFDFSGIWDPSLAFVMGGALFVTAIGYRFVLQRPAPRLDSVFHLPTKKDIDLPLVAGSATFGVGWGIAGFCPGGAIPALGSGRAEVVIFMVALVVGILTAKAVRSRGAGQVA